MTPRFRYLLAIVFLLVVASAFADARVRANGVVQTAFGEKCIECAAYAPTSGVYAKPTVKETKP